MSYILNALKKSEKERQLQNVPTLQTDHRDEHDAKNWRPIIWLLAAVVLSNVIGLIWWLGPWHDQQPFNKNRVETTQQVSALQATEQTEAISPAENIKSFKATADSEKNTTLPIVDKESAMAENTLPVTETDVPVAADNEVIVEAEPEGKELSAPPEEQQVVPPSVNAPQHTLSDEIAQEQVTEKVDPPIDSPVPQSNEAVVIEKIVEKDHLPYALQQDLPELAISLHLYAKSAQRRKVSINGRMRRQGDEISENLVLEEITPDGVILTFKGKRFHQKVF